MICFQMIINYCYELTEDSTSGLRDEVLSNILTNQVNNNNYGMKEPALSRGTTLINY